VQSMIWLTFGYDFMLMDYFSYVNNLKNNMNNLPIT